MDSEEEEGFEEQREVNNKNNKRYAEYSAHPSPVKNFQNIQYETLSARRRAYTDGLDLTNSAPRPREEEQKTP